MFFFDVGLLCWLVSALAFLVDLAVLQILVDQGLLELVSVGGWHSAVGHGEPRELLSLNLRGGLVV